MKHSMRPPPEEESEPLTVYVPAVPSSAQHNLISPLVLAGAGGAAGLTCQLELDIASLVFSHHHLFSLEHYMTRYGSLLTLPLTASESYVLFSLEGG